VCVARTWLSSNPVPQRRRRSYTPLCYLDEGPPVTQMALPPSKHTVLGRHLHSSGTGRPQQWTLLVLQLQVLTLGHSCLSPQNARPAVTQAESLMRGAPLEHRFRTFSNTQVTTTLGS
jgi:hypothetical protein